MRKLLHLLFPACRLPVGGYNLYACLLLSFVRATTTLNEVPTQPDSVELCFNIIAPRCTWIWKNACGVVISGGVDKRCVAFAYNLRCWCLVASL